MRSPVSRRAWLRWLGLSGVSAGVGQVLHGQATSSPVGEGGGFTSSVIQPRVTEITSDNAVLRDGKVLQPARELPLLAKTDVLVVGGGPAGVAAATPASRPIIAIRSP